MRRYSPYRSPPRRGYGGRVRSPPRRGYGGYGGRKEHNNGSLLVRNVPLDCRPEDIRIPFERFGRVRDVYIPKDYYTGEPRGFAFVQFVEPCDASEAQYHMNGQVLFGRDITVLIAAETRKNPQEMRNRSRVRGPSGYGGRRSSYYGRSRSRSVSRSRSPRHDSTSRMRRRSRSYSPVPRRQADYSVSPERRQTGQPRDHPHERDPRRQADYSVSPERRQAGQLRSPRDHPHERDPRRQAEYSVSPERRQAGQPRSPRDHPHERDPRRQADYSVSPERRQAGQPRSPRDQPHERDKDQIQNRRSYSPDYRNNNWNQSGNGYNERDPYDGDGVHHNWRSPGRISGSPPGSRSRSAELSPRRNRP